MKTATLTRNSASPRTVREIRRTMSAQVSENIIGATVAWAVHRPFRGNVLAEPGDYLFEADVEYFAALGIESVVIYID